MRVAALPNFRKIWGRIPGTVQAGTYVLTIQNGKKIYYFSLQCDINRRKEVFCVVSSQRSGRQKLIPVYYVFYCRWHLLRPGHNLPHS